MTNFEKIKNMSKEELIKFITENNLDDNIWVKSFTKKYCDKCESVIQKIPANVSILGIDREAECAYCEINKNCRFFEGKFIDGCPSDEEILSMWLEEEAENES